MDLQRLIQLVSERRALWDRNHPDYHNRYKIQLLWMDVGNELNEKYEMVKARWRGLRDNFRKELSKVNDGNQSRWCHFESMLFLKDHTIRQNTDNSQSFDQPDNIQSSDTQSNDGMGFEIIKLEPNLEEESNSKNYYDSSFDSINVNSESIVVNRMENKSDFDFIPVNCRPGIANTNEFMTSQNDSLSQTTNAIELTTLTDISKNHVDMFSENFQEPISATVNYNNNIVKEKRDFSENSPHSQKPITSNNSQLKSTFVSNNLNSPPESNKKPIRKKPKLDEDVEKLIMLEREKLSTLKKQTELQNDSNYHFLMSILPELQKIPSNRQLHVRIRIQELLLEEQHKAFNEHLS